MIRGKFTIVLFALFTICYLAAPGAGSLMAAEVDKGQIPGEHLSKAFKELPWGGPVYDVAEAVTQLKSKEKALWVDTRPESFFKQGTVRNAVLMPYNKTGGQGNELKKEDLEAAIASAGLSKEAVKIIFFCQGPKCHRSYNASFVTVTEWGFPPENIIWFRDGYPNLFNTVKKDSKLKRKAKKYLSDAGMKQL